MIFSIRNSWFKRHFPLVTQSEAVLTCMAFPILRKYFWQKEEGQEEGGHSSGVEIFLQMRNKKQYRRPSTVIKARLKKKKSGQILRCLWDGGAWTLGCFPSPIFQFLCFLSPLPSDGFHMKSFWTRTVPSLLLQCTVHWVPVVTLLSTKINIYCYCYCHHFKNWLENGEAHSERA